MVATIRKRAREEVETVPAIYMDALQGVAVDEDSEAVAGHLATLPYIWVLICCQRALWRLVS